MVLIDGAMKKKTVQVFYVLLNIEYIIANGLYIDRPYRQSDRTVVIHINVYIGWLDGWLFFYFFFSFDSCFVGNCFFVWSIKIWAPANYSNNEKGTASIHIISCITISVFYIIDIVIFIISFNSLAISHFSLPRLESASIRSRIYFAISFPLTMCRLPTTMWIRSLNYFFLI